MSFLELDGLHGSLDAARLGAGCLVRLGTLLAQLKQRPDA
jgi:hypothetical protein